MPLRTTLTLHFGRLPPTPVAISSPHGPEFGAAVAATVRITLCLIYRPALSTP
jgi:hypothetical protein